MAAEAPSAAEPECATQPPPAPPHEDETPPWLASAVDRLASTLLHQRIETGSARRRRRPTMAALILVLVSAMAVGAAFALHYSANTEPPASGLVTASGGSGALNLVRADSAGVGWSAEASLAALAGALKLTTSRGDAAVRDAAKYEAALRLTEHRLREGTLSLSRNGAGAEPWLHSHAISPRPSGPFLHPAVSPLPALFTCPPHGIYPLPPPCVRGFCPPAEPWLLHCLLTLAHSHISNCNLNPYPPFPHSRVSRPRAHVSSGRHLLSPSFRRRNAVFAALVKRGGSGACGGSILVRLGPSRNRGALLPRPGRGARQGGGGGGGRAGHAGPV
jgi:hypothetical protein